MSRSTNNTYPPLPPPRRLTYHEPYDFFFRNFRDDADEWAFGIPDSPLYDNFQPTQVTRTSPPDSRRPFGGTLAVARPFGLAGSAAPPGSRIHVMVLSDELARQANPSTRQMTDNQWNTATPGLEADSRLTRDQQKKALQKLKKEIYDPLRRISKRVNLYYRDTVVNEKEMENDEHGKRCAICLEDFEPKQEVMLTPCKHMFHEECIVPWVKSNGRCPVCRFSISE